MQLTDEARLVGRYIVTEGDEGAGKTTQLELLKARLEAELGVTVRAVREPGGDPLAEQIRNILKYAHVEGPEAAQAVVSAGHELPEITPLAEVALFSAARANMLERVIKPLLAQGVWVLADRSSTSTLVYQGAGRGLGMEFIRPAVGVFSSICRPDLEFILDIDLETSQHRQGLRVEGPDRIESAGYQFRATINSTYRRLASNESAVDGEGTIEQVHERIWTYIGEWLNWKKLTTTPHNNWRWSLEMQQNLPPQYPIPT